MVYCELRLLTEIFINKSSFYDISQPNYETEKISLFFCRFLLKETFVW